MYKFTISVDSTADLYHDFMLENDLRFVPLTFSMDKDGKLEEALDAFESYEDYKKFYATIRGGGMPHTAMLNYQSHYTHFKKMAEAGEKEVLHFTISSGLAPTITVAQKAYDDIKKEYPDFNLKIVDPLAATVGTGALVRYAIRLRNEGKTLDETFDLVNEHREKVQILFMADDLQFLKRGGRVSSFAAIFGSALNIKPIITFNKAGKLVVIEKAKGEKKVISLFKSQLKKDGVDPENPDVYIVHTDNEEMANEFARQIEEEFGIRPVILIMGPTIGSHVGPGAVGFCFFTTHERNQLEG